MRKLLIFMLVLGMASLATAVPTITVSNATPNPGDTIQVYITGTAAEASGPGGTPGGGYSGFMAIDYTNYNYYNYPTSSSPYLSITSFSPTITTAAGGYAAASGPSYGAAYWAAMPLLPWAEATDVDAGLWFTYNVSIDGVAGDVEVIDILDNAYGIIGSATVTITEIPEPMTMVLLGLGGLFLRRRK